MKKIVRRLSRDEISMLFIGVLIGLWIGIIIVSIIKHSGNIPFIVTLTLFIFQQIIIHLQVKELRYAKKKKAGN